MASRKRCPARGVLAQCQPPGQATQWGASASHQHGSHGPRNCCSREKLLGFSLFPPFLVGPGHKRPSRPRWAVPCASSRAGRLRVLTPSWGFLLGSGPSSGVKALLGLLLRFSAGELAPQLPSSLSCIPCLLSQVSLLQAWEGSGEASFHSNIRTIWP